jgi:hypothetical protein
MPISTLVYERRGSELIYKSRHGQISRDVNGSYVRSESSLSTVIDGFSRLRVLRVVPHRRCDGY